MLARWQGASLTRQLIPSAFRPLLGLRFLLGQAEQPASGRFFWGGLAVQAGAAAPPSLEVPVTRPDILFA